MNRLILALVAAMAVALTAMGIVGSMRASHADAEADTGAVVVHQGTTGRTVLLANATEGATCLAARDSIALWQRRLTIQRALLIKARREADGIATLVWQRCRTDPAGAACHQALPNLVGWKNRAFAHTLPPVDSLR